jgi:hypothetical protein
METSVNEAEDAITAALFELGTLINKLDRARRRCADLEWQVEGKLNELDELRRRAANKPS